MKNFINCTSEPISYLISAIAVYISLYLEESKEKWVLLLYFILSTAVMTIGVKDFFNGENNIDLYNFHFFSTVLFIGLYYQIILVENKKKILPKLFLIIGSFYFIIESLNFQREKLFDSFGYSFLSFSIVILFFAYCHQILNNVSKQPIFQSFNFWVNISLIIYHLGAFGIFLTYNQLTKKIITYSKNLKNKTDGLDYNILLSNLWGLHNILLLVSSVCLLIGLTWKIFNKTRRL